MSALIIDPEFRDLIPPLAPEEKDQLKRSIIVNGVMSELLVWKGTGILIDGHNRYQICQEIKMDFATKELSFDSRDAVKQFMILNQLGRRNVSPEMASKLRADYHASMSRGQGAPVGNDRASKQKPQNEVSVSETQSTAAAVAKATGVSKATVERDVQLGKALDKLGISRNDYAAGKVLDAKGKKRSKGSIIAEAFPPKPKEDKSAPLTEKESSRSVELEAIIENGISEHPEMFSDTTGDLETLMVDRTKAEADSIDEDEVVTVRVKDLIEILRIFDEGIMLFKPWDIEDTVEKGIEKTKIELTNRQSKSLDSCFSGLKNAREKICHGWRRLEWSIPEKHRPSLSESLNAIRK